MSLNKSILYCHVGIQTIVYIFKSVLFHSSFQVSVKRALMDNAFLQSLMKEPDALSGQHVTAKFSKDDIKQSSKDVKAIFGIVEPDFILRQVAPDKLVSLVVGLLKAYGGKPKVLTKIFSFLSSAVFQNDDSVKKEISLRRIDFALLTFPLLFSSNEVVVAAALEKIQTVSKLYDSKFSSLVQKLNLNEFTKRELFDQLTGLIDFESVCDLIDSIFDCKDHQEPDIISLALLFGSSTLLDFGCKEKGQILCKKLMTLTLKALQRFKVDVKDEEKGDSSNVELVSSAARKKSISAQVYDVIVEALKSTPNFCLDPKSKLQMFLETLILGSSLQTFGLDPEKCFEIFAGNDETVLMAKIASMKKPNQIFPVLEMDGDMVDSLFTQAQLRCAKKISTNLDHDKVATFLPHLLTCLTNGNRKIRKTIFKSFENFVVANLSKKSKSAAYLSLLKQIVEHKSEILSNVLNLSDVMKEFCDHEANDDIINNLLEMIIATESSHIFVQVSLDKILVQWQKLVQICFLIIYCIIGNL
jgi:hypothetical protein